MNTKQLRQKILDLAIRGKLVPQDPTDEPAALLLERVRAEKERLIKEGKIKRDKKDSGVLRSDDKSHYEQLPDGWAWCRLGNVVNEISTGPFGTMLHKADYIIDGIPMINPQHIIDGQIVPSEKVTVNNDTALRLSSYRLEANDIIIGRRGEMGRCAVASDFHEGWLCGTGCFVLRNNSNINSNFLATLIRSERVVSFLSANSIGATMNNLNHSILNQVVLALPPLAEQHRIVAAIESAFAVIDEIEQNKTDLQFAVVAAKSKILSIAIRGKLVPQDPNDEPASLLLERIRAERETLIKAGKVKRGKSESAAVRSCDNSYYAGIPESWENCQLGEICDIARGGSPRPIQDYITNDNNGINWIKIGDTAQGSKYITEAQEKIKPEGLNRSRFVQAGDFLLTNSMSFGRPYILKIDGCIHDGWLVIGDVQKAFSHDFLYHLLSSDWAYQSLSSVAYGSTVKNLKSDTVKAFTVPIPPIDEQKRIVIAIEAAFEQLDNISAMLA